MMQDFSGYNTGMHHTRRTDANQQEIMNALREVGYSVLDLHEVGKGCPDILVGTHGLNILVEIKIPGAKLNDLEKKFFDSWNGPACVVNSVEEAITTIDKIVAYERKI